MHVIVVGAGVIGCSIAAHLAERGAQVTLLDRDHPGSGTSSTSYAWVNANGKEPEAYLELNAAGLRAHHDLASNGAPWFVPNGHVEVTADEAHDRHLRTRMERLQHRGYPVQELTRSQAAALVPDLRLPAETRTIAYFPEEGHLFPSLYIGAMLARARAAGVQIRTNTEVLALEPRQTGATLRTTGGHQLTADAVVAAAGRWTADLATLTGARVPLAEYSEPGDVTVGYLATTSALPSGLDRLLTTPWLNVRPAGGGRLLLQALDLDAAADPADVPAPDSALARAYLTRLRDVLHGTDGAHIDNVCVGQRVMPADGLTIVGTTAEQPWLYVVATHSGVTLAPLLGQGVATEVLGGQEPLFEEFRPTRFLQGVPAQAPTGPRKPGEQ